jgi:competence protein ComEC
LVKQTLFSVTHPDYSGPSKRLVKDDEFAIGGVWHKVIHPDREMAAHNHNAMSLVMTLQYGYFSALLTGDIGMREEYPLLPHLTKVTLLKVGHHGSRFSTSPELLRVIQPELAIISAGRRNPFGHPAPEVIQRIEDSGGIVFSTSKWGSLRVITDGFDWTLQHYSMEDKRFLTLRTGSADASKPTQTIKP